MASLFPTAKADPELMPFRPGLVFAFFNALAWQIGIGTPMVLFSCPKDEGMFVGNIRPRTLPAGRAQFVNRRRAVTLVQTPIVR